MALIDWMILAVYGVAMIGLSIYLSRGQTSEEDYYVGGRDLPWWAVGISTMATQTSAVSFISIPAFVALKPGGGMTWLQYELAVPLAMIITSIALLPFFRQLKLISVYAYLEMRFGPSVRFLISAVFLLSRSLGTAVGLYASAIILTVMLDLPVWSTILLMSVFTIIYDTIGGIKAVVFSDVIQMFILLVGILFSIGFALKFAGGMDMMLDSIHPERLKALDFTLGIEDGSSTPFWGFLVGGLFLYISYYGTDQSQVQRDPAGVRGILIAALLAASMSSLDSALNSLSAATMRDFIDKWFNLSSKQTLFVGKVTTVVWGCLIAGFALVVGGISDTVIESINKIGSTFYGPILAAFLIGLLSRRASTGGMLIGIISGVTFNLTLWIFFPGTFWMWWNLSGVLVAGSVTMMLSLILPPPKPEQIEGYTLAGSGFFQGQKIWNRAHTILVLYFFCILLFMFWLNTLAG